MMDTLALVLNLIQTSAETAEAVEPWMSEELAIYIGAYGGAGLGVLGGVLGGVGGPMAQKGKAKGPILGAFTVVACLGLVLLLVGIAAVIAGQPYVIYYPFLLLGFLSTAVFGGLIPVMRRNYAIAEQRKMEAEALRRA